METARALLSKASKSFQIGISSEIEKFLKGAKKKKLKPEDAKLYTNFIRECLHHCMTKLKGGKDKIEVEEILKTTVVCAECYQQSQPCQELDTTHAVLSLLFHTPYSIKDTAHTYVEYILRISEIVFVVINDAGCPETSHAIIDAFYSFLWNVTSKHMKQGASQSLKDDLAFQKLSLQFFCCTPSNFNKICLYLQTVIAHYTRCYRKEIDEGMSEVFHSIFKCISDKLQMLSNSEKSVKLVSECRCTIYKVNVLLIEYLLSVSDYIKAREVIQDLKVSCGSSPLCEVLIDVLSYNVSASEAFKNSKQLDISSEKIRAVNSELTKLLQTESFEYLKLVFRGLESFLQSVSRIHGLDTSLVKDLLECCSVVYVIYEKLDARNIWEEDTKDVKNKTKDAKNQSSDKKACIVTRKQDYVQGCCIVYFRQLSLLQRLLVTDKGVEKFRQCVATAQKLSKFIDENNKWLTQESLQNKRNSFGSLCRVIGTACMQAGHYVEAATLFTIVIEQLHGSGQPNLIKMFEKLMDCYMEQEKWMEAIQTIVHAFTTVHDDLKSLAFIWTKLRREASSKDAVFQSMTLNSVIKSSGVDLKGVTCRQLLIAEYLAWKRNPKRQFDMEYPVFVELLEDTKQMSSEKAEAMVALASNMCITGYKYNDLSAGELLNKAIITLDKNLAGNESTLAVACFLKYVILHEETVEYMKNENGDIEYFGTADISADSRYTLQQEQDNLPFLVRAIEMWEKSFCPGANKSGDNVCTKGETLEEKVFGLDYHIDNLLLCGTRLIAMKQPQLALRALQVAKSQIANIKDTKTASDLSLQVSRSLMLLGRYTEAQSVMDSTGDNKIQGETANEALHLSELYMLTGKRDTGLKILQSVLDSNELLGKTYKDYFMQGTANRLLSMALCLPDGDHMINSTNQYLLSLAFESVHCQVTVLNFLTKNKSLDKNINKWLILNEILASMLHMCQLFRFIGLPREALCYLKTGLNISQGQGLPRWSCEFLMEMLGVQSMEAECDKALSTAESLDCILNPDNQSRKMSVNQSKTGSSKNNQSAINQSSQSSVNHDENSELPLNSSVQNCSSNLKKTPERIYVKEELDSEKKNKMKKLTAPRCCCMVGKCDHCTDIVRHKLCMKAGIVLSDFLAQTDMKSTSYQLLTDVQSKFAILNNISSDSLSCMTDLNFSGDLPLVKNGQDPQLLYSCLEAGCIKAEYYLHKKDFLKVHKIWTIFQNMEKSGHLKNVLHSNILLTRLALCDASGYMLSLPENQTKLNQTKLSFDVDETSHKLEKLSINAGRKVSFEEDESWSLTGTCMKLVRKVSKFADIMSPIKPPAVDVLSTPVVVSSTKKSKMPLTTPTTNRMMILENLIASDEEDDFVFPKPKPITPGVLTKSARKSRMTSRTEPRNLIHKKPAFKIAEDPVDGNKSEVACKLNFLPQSTSDASVIDVEDESLVKETKVKARKQGKKEKCSSMASLNKSAGHSGESVDTTDIKIKSNIPKRSARKQASVKTKKIEQSADDNFPICEEGINEISEMTEKDIDVLQEKKVNTNNASLSKSNNAVDVFDFELEDSPVVVKVTKTGKTRQTKGAQRGKKASGTSRKPIKNDSNSDEKGVENKENDSLVKPQRTTRRGRPKKTTDDTVEMVRNSCHDLDECEPNISMEELILNYDSFSEYYQQNFIDGTDDLDQVEFENEQHALHVAQRQVDGTKVEFDLNLEPIEIMRADTVKKGKGGKRRGRGVKAVSKTDDLTEEASGGNTEFDEAENVVGDDSNDRRRSKEMMRSGRLMSMNELTATDMMDIPSCIEDTESDCSEPSSADIISTMESLYEKLCKFPPNPQHSDVCHMLALLHLDNNPMRAAFLLNDAIAVTFRHQVLLNLGKKARKEVKGSVASACQRTILPEESVLFSGEDHILRDMVKSIPEGWCVAQISVIKVGLPCQQMILTRFVKNEDPIIVKIPGFSSVQGQQALKDFSTVLEQSSKSAKIQSSTEWWETRRKLDTDMASVIDRIEKYLLGHWRCAVTAGKFQDQILNVVCKEIHNITGKDVTTACTELLLIAHQIMTEKELRQCISELLDIRDPSDLESIISVLKKYSKLNIGSVGKMSHTVLILDKTVQHLPWESIPVLSDKSVSRMPCLSHLVTQLDKHYKGNNSVFVKGVNLQNTFYILTPDSDLPRTQEFFQEWFQSEEGWSGVVGCRPSSEQFIEALTQKDFLIFCGHGTGGRMFSSDEIEKLTARAVTMLMGCSSGKLHVKGQLEPTGMMISYFLAGCPSMVANLWDVTDKDIDKFTENVIKTWMSSSHGTYLTNIVQKARAVCKLKYLNGLAPVVYGLPVFINKKDQ